MVSSVLFGALHGRWLAGTIAGMFYAWALYRRGRVEDAILAHALTNALIAAAVLMLGTLGAVGVKGRQRQGQRQRAEGSRTPESREG